MPNPKVGDKEIGDQNMAEPADSVQDSMVNIMNTSNFELVTKQNEVQVTNNTPGKTHLPLNKNSVNLKMNFF